MHLLQNDSRLRHFDVKTLDVFDPIAPICEQLAWYGPTGSAYLYCG